MLNEKALEVSMCCMPKDKAKKIWLLNQSVT